MKGTQELSYIYSWLHHNKHTCLQSFMLSKFPPSLILPNECIPMNEPVVNCYIRYQWYDNQWFF